jgi:hypothetical protein
MNDGVKNIAFGYLPSLYFRLSAFSQPSYPRLTPGQRFQSLQTLSLSLLHPLYSTSAHTSIMDDFIVWIYPHSRIAEPLMTDPAMIFLSDNNSSTPSTFLLHMFRSKGEIRRETDLQDGLKGSEDTFFAYYSVGTANTSKEV